MRRSSRKLRGALASLSAAAVLAWALSSALPSQALAKPVMKGRVVDVKVHGRSLEGNLEGDSPDRSVSIYLPPSYDHDKRRRYPVVYLLHGYFLTNQYWVGGTVKGLIKGIDVPGMMDRDIASGKGREMIIVMPDGDSKYDGSMYSTSATVGDWESFIAADLVSYVDSHYRTIAKRASRGLAGHSMGGYGTIRIGMKRPDVFSSLYVMSACCLINDASRFAQQSNANGSANGNDGKPNPFARIFRNVVKAEAAAWSPDPNNPPTYFDLPGGKGGASDSLIAAKWAANSPLAMVDQYIPNLKRYSYIAMDVGTKDSLMDSNKQLADVLTAYGIKHTFQTYVGTHANRIAERVEDHVIPFFSKHLDFKR
jgi:S-formylglutathione hydrolase FrmB